MKRITQQLVEDAGKYVAQFLEEKLPANIEFHTVKHAKSVAENVAIIGGKCELNNDEINLVKFCAWFHDTGYINGPNNHEEESVKIALAFLKSNGIQDNDLYNQIQSCILATRTPQQPKDLLSKVLCDADLMHLAQDNYFENILKMRKEWNNLSEKKISKLKFHKTSLAFFQQHTYFTDFAKKELQPQKDKNLELLQKEIIMLEEQKQTKKKKKKKKKKGYSRGVESMFRNTARMQINLSSIADKKSNILISVNSIIISIAMSFLVSKFDEAPNLVIPTVIFLTFSLFTIVFAIRSTRPRISSGTFKKEDIKHNKVNLLFFGNFYNMELEDYEWAIGELLKNDDNLYAVMIQDQYALGKVLARKYKLLRIAYNIFMFGIVISVIAFILAFVWGKFFM